MCKAIEKKKVYCRNSYLSKKLGLLVASFIISGRFFYSLYLVYGCSGQVMVPGTFGVGASYSFG